MILECLICTFVLSFCESNKINKKKKSLIIDWKKPFFWWKRGKLVDFLKTLPHKNRPKNKGNRQLVLILLSFLVLFILFCYHFRCHFVFFLSSFCHRFAVICRHISNTNIPCTYIHSCITFISLFISHLTASKKKEKIFEANSIRFKTWATKTF